MVWLGSPDVIAGRRANDVAACDLASSGSASDRARNHLTFAPGSGLASRASAGRAGYKKAPDAESSKRERQAAPCPARPSVDRLRPQRKL